MEKDVTTLPCYKKLAGVHTCWTRVGPGGKADWCSWLGAHAIFDDCNEIIQECHANGIMAHAICTKWTQHSNTPAKMVFRDLAEAVEAYLGPAGGNLAWLWKRPLGPLGAEELWERLPCHETRALEKATGSTLLKSFGKGSPHGKRLWERPPTSAWEWLWKRVLIQILCTGLASPKWAGHDKLLTD